MDSVPNNKIFNFQKTWIIGQKGVFVLYYLKFSENVKWFEISIGK